MARYSFSGSIPQKLEHKLRRQEQRFRKIATTVVLAVRNIPKFKDRANWSRDTFQPMRRRACVYQQTNQNIAPVIKIFKTTDGVGQNQSSFRGSQAYF